MNFEAINEEQLLFQFAINKIKVPPRGAKRTTEHTELWLIQKFISTLNSFNKLTFPLILKNRERPDFELIMNGQSSGIEITEIIHPDYAKAMTLPEVQGNAALVDASLFKWGTPKKSLAKLREMVSRTELTGTPWMGNAVEKEFVKSVIDTINSKHKKYTNGYKTFDNNCLLIYHNQSSPFIDYNNVINLIHESLNNYWDSTGFDRIYIHKNNKLLGFIKSNNFVYNIPS